MQFGVLGSLGVASNGIRSFAPTSSGITFVDDLTFTIDAGTSTESKALPAGTTTNDVVIIGLVSDFDISGGGINTSGYNTISSVGASATPSYLLTYKVMGVTPDTTVVINQVSGVPQAGVLQVWRSIDTTISRDNSGGENQDSGAVGMPNPGASTSVTNNALIMITGFLDDDNAVTGSSAPSGYDNLSASENGATVFMASKILVTAGSTGDPDAFGGTGTDSWYAYTMSWRPA